MLRFAFFIAIAVVAYFFWRDFGRREIETLADPGAVGVLRGGRAVRGRPRLVLCSDGLQGRDALAFFLVAAACVYAGVRTWLDQKRLV